MPVRAQLQQRRSAEMKEAILSPDLSAQIVDSDIPEPGREEILIEVVCAGCNPKDWKSLSYSTIKANSGDDIAGVVVKVGQDVYEFQAGNRVAAFHQMRTRGGAFAEFAIAPASTTFHLPDDISFAEAATIPLAALTAAIALFHNLRLPAPWEQSITKTPLLIYGGSTAIGAFAIKLARRSHISPLMVVAGRGRPFVESLLDPAQGDTLIDYREGPDAVVLAIRTKLEALRCGPAFHAFDTISDEVSTQTLTRVLDPSGHITLVLPEGDYTSIPSSLKTSLTFVGIVHTAPLPLSALKGIRYVAEGSGRDFGFIYSRLFSRALQEGWLCGHPHEIVPLGLQGLSSALRRLKLGQASAVKYIIRPGDTGDC